MIKGAIGHTKRRKKGSPVIKGSLVWLKRVCGKRGCRCYSGEKHVSLYVSRSVKGRTVMTYIPHRYEIVVTQAVAEYKRILKTLEKASLGILAAIHEGKEI